MEISRATKKQELPSHNNYGDNLTTFNPSDFLRSFRQFAIDNKMFVSGAIANEIKMAVSEWEDEAEKLAMYQIEQLTRRVPGYISEESVSRYVLNYRKSVRFLGYVAYKAQAGSYSLLNILSDEIKRHSIFTQLSREYRRSAWELVTEEQKNSRNIPLAVWQSSKPHVHSNSYVRSLVNKFPDLGTEAVKNALLRYNYGAQEFLEESSKKFGLFMKDPKYKSLGKSTVKRAVINYPKNPSGRLDAILKSQEVLANDRRFRKLKKFGVSRESALLAESDIELKTTQITIAVNKLMSVQRYRSFGMGAIKRAIKSNIKNPENVMDIILNTYSLLLEDEAFKEIPKSIIKYFSINYIHYEKTQEKLEFCLNNYHRLRASGKYSIFGNRNLIKLCFNNKNNIDSIADQILHNYNKFINDKRFADLGKQTIERAVFKNRKDPELELQRLAKLMDEINNDPRYISLPRHHIRFAVAYYSNPYSYLNKQLRQRGDSSRETILETFYTDERFGEFSTTQIKRAVDMYGSTGAEKVLLHLLNN